MGFEPTRRHHNTASGSLSKDRPICSACWLLDQQLLLYEQLDPKVAGSRPWAAVSGPRQHGSGLVSHSWVGTQIELVRKRPRALVATLNNARPSWPPGVR
eukprot:Protomagalhaensia_sp_Gyna_25__4482@NODE_410_length_3521_cov_33_292361_g316_i0_p4_GENE_NODE_410_length_3521_cov_33_292361_g316_i0NODE_410_length_3521_cov_33_292361_g316_i0_p4_ORF_typecomplete_len100_score3_14znribbon_14/PF16503_5/1_2znribbon_14/PF16503_5/6e02_NODE_410_length_3521_cov_33_292361_g316_i019312230